MGDPKESYVLGTALSFPDRPRDAATQDTTPLALADRAVEGLDVALRAYCEQSGVPADGLRVDWEPRDGVHELDLVATIPGMLPRDGAKAAYDEAVAFLADYVVSGKKPESGPMKRPGYDSKAA